MFCDLLFGLIGLLIVCIIIYFNKDIFNDFKKNLNSSQSKILENILIERKQYLILSFIISIIIVFVFSFIFNINKIYNKICINFSLIILLSFYIYNIIPKKDDMIYHLKSKKQIQDWLNIYKLLKFLLMSGFLIGIIFYFFLSKLFKNIF